MRIDNVHDHSTLDYKGGAAQIRRSQKQLKQDGLGAGRMSNMSITCNRARGDKLWSLLLCKVYIDVLGD